MRCLVFVKFFPGGSLPPEEFFTRINAQWSHLEDTQGMELDNTLEKPDRERLPKSAICIADYDSIEQLAMDLAIMPGAGISNVEVVPISEETEIKQLSTDISPGRVTWQ
jgi:hypothetical protein